MDKRFLGTILIALFAAVVGFTRPARAADEYTVDPVHTSVYFKISHFGFAYVFGRFNDVSGNFTIDANDPGRCTFDLKIAAASVDTHNDKRDEHLRSPDFFNVKQFPVISFKSTSVKVVPNGYDVTGDLAMHGVTRPVSFTLTGGRKGQFPPGVTRTGFSTELNLKRSDFGMERMSQAGRDKIAPVGDEVRVAIGMEGTKK